MGKKTVCRFWTISDFGEEETWLREQHKSGRRFVKFTVPCFYEFEQCEPEDVIYRLDFKNNDESAEYIQIVSDFGWEYAGKCLGWIYFRKPASSAENENDGELFSDNASRLDRVEKIIKMRLIPFTIIFICCVIPGTMKSIAGEFGPFMSSLYYAMFVFYIYIIVHCGKKLRRMRSELE